jgi:gliding motility-associated-like protein
MIWRIFLPKECLFIVPGLVDNLDTEIDIFSNLSPCLTSGFNQYNQHLFMRLKLLRQLTVISFILFLSGISRAQNFSFNCSRDTIVPGCPANLCITLKGIVPDIHGLTSSYTLNPGSFNSTCFPIYGAPDDPGGTPTNLTIDDRYSSPINMGFPFPFYGTIYNDLVASTNGYISFDLSLAGQFSHYANNGDLPNTQYDRALIMGPYHDLFPGQPTSPQQRIQYQVFGSAPHRRWILSFFKVPLFQCTGLIENTHQIILYESTGIFEVKIFDKQICFGWQGGKSMVGIQDFNRSSGMTAPLRKMSDPAWGSIGMNETWRFVPSAGFSLLKRVELYDLSNNLIATGVTGPLLPGCLEASFPNICAPAGTITSYILKSVYQKIDDPVVEIFGTDTIRINRLVPLTGNTSTTPAGCGLSNGTITVTGVTGGTAPYEYSLDGIVWQSSNVFSGLAAGSYTVYIRDFGAVCNTSIPVTVGITGTIPATTSATPTSCAGVSNGSITITSAGGSGPYTFSLDGGAPIPGTIPFTFSNLSAGNHTIIVTDQVLGCSTVLMNVNVPAGIGITGIISTTATSCPGAANGTITATALSGVPPFSWQLDGGPVLPGTSPYTFTNVTFGPHVVRITDNLGCVSFFNANVAAGPGINGSTTSTATSCVGASNGTIIATALSGTAPFTWSIDGAPPVPGVSPYTFTNVAAGLHVITIIDNLGCNIVMTETVVAGPGINGTTSSTATSCPAVSNGTIIATALSGTAPFTWSIDGVPPVPGASPYTFTNVAAGLHFITIIDNQGCSIVMTETVVAGAGITGSFSSTATSCPGVTNGTITATALSGTAPFTWSLDGAPPVPGASPYTFINVAAGPHTVTITDNLGCNVVLSVTVTAGAGINGNASSTATSCPAINNGTITATALTGTAPFTWSLDGAPSVPGASPYTFINVAAGPHTVTITDNIGCNVLLIETVAAGIGNTGSATSTATSCPTVNNGTIIATALTGTAPFTWSLDGAPAVPGASPYTFINVAAGPHTVTITDNAGCNAIVSVTVTAGSVVTATTSTTSAECASATNGTITISTATGNSPYTFTLDGGAPVAGIIPYTFNNVSPGNHTVVVTDATGCGSAPISVTVAIGSGVSATATTTGTICPTYANGTITVAVTAGYTPFTYSLDGGAPQSWPNPSYIFNGVAAGTHTVVITDIYGCTFTLNNIVVAAGPPLTTTVTTTDVLCHGGSTGIITVAPPLGLPCQYSLDNINWQSSNIFNGLIAGTYTVYYRTIANGCQGSQAVTINEPPVLAATNSTIPAVCNGQLNGTITINANGGVSPYQYSIDGGVNWQAGNVFTVAAGTYTIIIRDANNCTTTRSATVTEPAILTAASVNGNASCDGGNDGVITINAAGGNSGYTYSIDGVNFQPSNVFNVAPGPYTITVKDNLGCSTTFNTVVGLTNNLSFTPQTDPTICEGNSTQLQLVSNATVYSWTPATGLSNAAISNPVASPTVTTQYTVTATLGRCSANDIVIVNVNTAPIPDAGPDGFICYGQTYQLQGSGGVQYTWTPSTNLSNTAISNPVSTAVKTITYTLSEVIDAIGCKSLTTDQVTVDVTPPIKVKTFPYDTISYPGDQFQLNATSAATFYSWSPVTGLSNPNIPNPVLTVGPVGSDVLYQVIASTAAGCKGEGYVHLKVYNGPELYVPSAFTPNGDGLNELFYPFPVGIRSIKYFKVFNRWGQLLFSSTTLYKGWDGKLQGVEQPTGVYVFMTQGVDKNGKLLTHQGTVTLIR